MGNYLFKYPSASLDVTLTYPTSSGTFALVGAGGFSLNNASGSRLVISDGTTSAATASANLTFAGNILTVSSSTATTNAAIRNLNIINNTTGTATASLGVGIEFESESSTTENKTIGFFDYVWTNHTNAAEWGQTEISLVRGGTTQKSHMFAPGVISSFKGGFIPTNGQLGDFGANFSEFKVYASGSTSDGNTKSLTFGLSNAPTALVVPNDTTWMFTIYVVARRQDADNESAAYWIQGAIDNNAGTTAMVALPQVTAVEDSVGWNATVQAVAGMNIRVTGEAAKTVYWNAVAHIVQVSG